MRSLPAVRSARWRSWIGTVLDHGVDLCFNAGHRLLAFRERIAPTDGELTPERADAILAGVMSRIDPLPPVRPFSPSSLDLAAADLACELQRTVWKGQRQACGIAVAVEHRAVHRAGKA